MHCLYGLQKWFADSSVPDGREARRSFGHVDKSKQEPSVHRGDAAHWFEVCDCGVAPPPSPVHDAPEQQGAIILPPEEEFPAQCGCCGGSLYGVMCCDVARADCVVHYGCWGKWRAEAVAHDLQIALGQELHSLSIDIEYYIDIASYLFWRSRPVNWLSRPAIRAGFPAIQAVYTGIAGNPAIWRSGPSIVKI